MDSAQGRQQTVQGVKEGEDTIDERTSLAAYKAVGKLQDHRKSCCSRECGGSGESGRKKTSS